MKITKEQLLQVKEVVLNNIDLGLFGMTQWKVEKSCGTICCIGGTMVDMGLLNGDSLSNPTSYLMPDLYDDRKDYYSKLFRVDGWQYFASDKLQKRISGFIGYFSFDKLPKETKREIIELVFDDYIKKYCEVAK
jgi:hypothetical protein